MTTASSTTGISDEALRRLRGARGFIFDMDGTLALGDRVNHGLAPLPGAVELLGWARAQGLPYVVFTNGSNRSPADFAAVLRDAGLDVPDDQMMTPASSAVVMFTRRGYKRVTVLGGDGLTGPLRAAGIEVVPPVEAAPDHTAWQAASRWDMVNSRNQPTNTASTSAGAADGRVSPVSGNPAASTGGTTSMPAARSGPVSPSPPSTMTRL